MKRIRESVNDICGSVILVGLLAANVGAYRTLYRNLTTSPVPITQSTNMSEVIRQAEGDDLEEKVGAVISEHINFNKESVSAGFEEKLFGFLKDKVGDIRWKKLSIEEKINYAQMFSSTLEHNTHASWIDAMTDDKSTMSDVLNNSVEFYKINTMSAEEIMDYKTVVCGQYAQVFAAALYAINDSSANKEDLHVGAMGFVPNYSSKFGGALDFIVASMNAFAFGEYRTSIGHAVNLVVTDDKFYIIEPQVGARDNVTEDVNFSVQVLEIDNDYVNKLK